MNVQDEHRHRLAVRRQHLCWVFVLLIQLSLVGCGKVKSLLPKKSFHGMVGWKAEEYFDDPQVVCVSRTWLSLSGRQPVQARWVIGSLVMSVGDSCCSS